MSENRFGRARLRTAGLMFIGIYGLAVLNWQGYNLPDPRPDAVAHLMAAFGGAIEFLPTSGTIGYVGPQDPTVSDGEVRFIAQYALAPRLIVDDLSDQRAAISRPGLASEVHQAMLTQGWVVTRELPGGIRIYRR